MLVVVDNYPSRGSIEHQLFLVKKKQSRSKNTIIKKGIIDEKQIDKRSITKEWIETMGTRRTDGNK